MKHFSSWADVELMQQRNEINEYDISGWRRSLSDMVATFEQIKKASELYPCWGVGGAYVGLWDKSDPCLLLKVDGAKHKGLTLWAYDEGADLYYLANLDEHGELMETHTEIYFDMVEGVLDELIERDPEWTDEEYRKRAEADSEKKGFPFELLNMMAENGKTAVCVVDED